MKNTILCLMTETNFNDAKENGSKVSPHTFEANLLIEDIDHKDTKLNLYRITTNSQSIIPYTHAIIDIDGKVLKNKLNGIHNELPSPISELMYIQLKELQVHNDVQSA